MAGVHPLARPSQPVQEGPPFFFLSPEGLRRAHSPSPIAAGGPEPNHR